MAVATAGHITAFNGHSHLPEAKAPFSDSAPATCEDHGYGMSLVKRFPAVTNALSSLIVDPSSLATTAKGTLHLRELVESTTPCLGFVSMNNQVIGFFICHHLGSNHQQAWLAEAYVTRPEMYGLSWHAFTIHGIYAMAAIFVAAITPFNVHTITSHASGSQQSPTSAGCNYKRPSSDGGDQERMTKQQRGDSNANNQDDNDDAEEGGDDRLPDDHGAGSGSHTTWACPFYKQDRVKYFRCLCLKLTTPSYVKQHIKRWHTLGNYYCPDCYLDFGNKKDSERRWKEHIQTGCSEAKNCSKLTLEQFKVLDELKLRGLAYVDQWRLIHQQIFPEEPIPDSPYVREPLNEAAAILRDQNEPGIREALRSQMLQLTIEVPEDALSSLTTRVADEAYKSSLPAQSRRQRFDASVSSSVGNSLAGSAATEAQPSEDSLQPYSERVQADVDGMQQDPGRTTSKGMSDSKTGCNCEYDAGFNHGYKDGFVQATSHQVGPNLVPKDKFHNAQFLPAAYYGLENGCRDGRNRLAQQFVTSGISAAPTAPTAERNSDVTSGSHLGQFPDSASSFNTTQYNTSYDSGNYLWDPIPSPSGNSAFANEPLGSSSEDDPSQHQARDASQPAHTDETFDPCTESQWSGWLS